MDDLVARVRGALGERYRLERVLGQGGMATVYLAEDLRHHRQVALKVLRPELAAALGPARFLREIEVTAKLNHPHILPLLDSGEADGLLYYAMPYVEGESLRDRLVRERQLPIDDALKIAGEVADALGFAHQHNVLHRDVKPENILLEAKHAVVADFGVARAIAQAGETRLTETGLSVGTPAYLSPEQASGELVLDGRSDVYALGCVLYEMLSGEPPFVGPTVESIIHQHLAVEPLAVTGGRPTVPDDVAVVVAQALAKAPADRQQTAEAFGQAIAAARVRLGSPSADITPKDARLRPSRPAAMRRRRVWIGAVAAAGVIAALGSLLLLPRRGGRTLDPNRVLVVAFADQTGSGDSGALGRMAQDYIVQVLTEAGIAEVVDPLTSLVVSQNVAAAGVAAGPGDVSALAQEAGAGTVVSGSYYAAGDSVYIQTRIADARHGRLMGTVGPIGGSVGARSELVGHLGRQVVAALAPLLNRDLRSWEPAAQPASLEAYEAYNEGLETYLRDEGKAAPVFERAAAADPTFSRATLWAAQSYMLAGWSSGSASDYAKAESLLAPLIESPGRLSRYDRCRLDFVRAMGPRQNHFAMYDAARCMVDAAPGSDDARREVAIIALRINRPRESRRLLEQLDPDRGLLRRWSYWSFLGRAYHMIGDYEGELDVGRKGLKRFPDVQSYFTLARALAALGRLDEVRARVAAARQLDPQDLVWYGDLRSSFVGAVAQELRAHGHRDAALELLHESIAQYQQRPHDTEQVQARLAELLYLAEQWGDARRRYEELAAAHPDNTTYLGMLGCLAARRGDREEALSISERLRSPSALWPEWSGSRWRAGIAALLGDREEATTLLHQAFEQGAQYGVSLHRDMNLESLHDYPPFQELLRPKG